MCAAPGCTADAVKQIDYGRGLTRGYCEEHAKDPGSISRKQLRMPFVLSLLGLLFVGHFIMAFGEAYTGKVKPVKGPAKKPHDPFRYFLWLTIAGIVGVNGIFWFLARYVC
jgi:hypothetical protein